MNKHATGDVIMVSLSGCQSVCIVTIHECGIHLYVLIHCLEDVCLESRVYDHSLDFKFILLRLVLLMQ